MTTDHFLDDRLSCVKAILDADLTEIEKRIAHMFLAPFGGSNEDNEYEYKLSKARMAQNEYFHSIRNKDQGHDN